MKPIYKIIAASVIGTSFMTLYSYHRSRKENQQYREPVLLNKLINRSELLPVTVEDNHPAGWVSHYAVGMLFVVTYYALWKKALHSPGPVRSLTIGTASGVIAIGAWKTMFAANDNPPANDRQGYYRQLFIAHLIFSSFALAAYKVSQKAADAIPQ